MTWSNKHARFRIVMLLSTLVIMESSVTFAEEMALGVNLSHICVHPKPCEYDGGLPIIMLHGLTDIKETWDSIYQDVSLQMRRTVCIYDARNHGDSTWNDTFNVDVLAEDLGSFMNMMKIERATLIGHSTGGRTIMKFALSNPTKVDRFFVEDIGLASIPEIAVEAITFRINVLLSSLDVIPDDADETIGKKAVLDYLRKVSNESVPEHFAKHLPLRLRDGVWKWKSNFDLIKKTLENPTLFFPKLEGGIYEGKALFLYGTASMYKVDGQEKSIRQLFPNAELVGVKGAGHYIHWKYPEFMRELLKFLK